MCITCNKKLSVYTQARQFDPTHTLFLRAKFASEMRKRFRALRGIINKAIIEQDVFGLTQDGVRITLLAKMNVPGRNAFAFPRNSDKVNAFMSWLKQQEQTGILETTTTTATENAWTNTYIEKSYKKGIIRGRAELRKAKFVVPSLDSTGGIFAAFNPQHIDRAELLFTRAFTDLQGITSTMDTQISKVLSKGLLDGENPKRLAKSLTKTISGPVGDLGITDSLGRFIPAERRAVMLARTEVIRAHHMATINEYRNWGVAGVKVNAEFRTAGDDRVCPDCAALEGDVFTLDEIETIIPVHPMCRCVTIPVEV